jgi:hypothetical protein
VSEQPIADLGVHECGLETCRVRFNPNFRGASFQGRPSDRGTTIVVVGFDEDWFRMVAALVHEAFELAADRRGCRFTRSGDIGRDNADYSFVLNHAEFAHCCACAGDFVATVSPALLPLWEAEKARRAANPGTGPAENIEHAVGITE